MPGNPSLVTHTQSCVDTATGIQAVSGDGKKPARSGKQAEYAKLDFLITHNYPKTGFGYFVSH